MTRPEQEIRRDLSPERQAELAREYNQAGRSKQCHAGNWGGGWISWGDGCHVQNMLGGHYRIVRLAKVNGMKLRPTRSGACRSLFLACVRGPDGFELLSPHWTATAARQACERNGRQAADRPPKLADHPASIHQ
jgi:hypothetical protein